MTARFADMTSAVAFNGDDELILTTDGINAYLDRDDVRALRDHLTRVLGEDTAPPLMVVTAPGMPREAALKLAEQTVTKLAPLTDSHGYSTSNAPALRDRVDSILRIAGFLTTAPTEETE